MKIGIALAGGGLKGAAYIGALRAFEELGIKFDCISGTSSGSMTAALYAAGYTCDELTNIVLKSYKGLTRIGKKQIISSVGAYLTRNKVKIRGLIPGERLESCIQAYLDKKGCTQISDVKIPLAVATVDTISTKECIFMSKNFGLKSDDKEYLYDVPLGMAVRASMSFPGIYTTSKYKQYNFIDGGTKDNLPIRVLKDMGADVTIGLSFKMDEYETDNENVINVILRAADIFSQKDIKDAQKEANIAIEIDASGTGLMESDNIYKCIETGYNTIIKRKDDIFKVINKTI